MRQHGSLIGLQRKYGYYETGLSTIKQETATQTRFSRTDGNRRRTQDPGEATSKAADPANGLKSPDQRLPRSARLRSNRDFQEAYAQRRRVIGCYMVLFIRSGPDNALRLGVVASRRVGNAVARARAKRRLREAFRRVRHDIRDNRDVVLVARRSILRACWKNVESDLQRVLQKAGFLPGKRRD